MTTSAIAGSNWVPEQRLNSPIITSSDNAVKYCDEAGAVSVSLSRKGKTAQLGVSNTYTEGKEVDVKRFFERFYRQDESHNSGKSGFGIGLSMAREMTERLKGEMDVSYDGQTIAFFVRLP